MNTSLLLPSEVADRLRCSKQTVMDELRKKNLRGIKTRAGWRVSEEDLATYQDAKANVSRVRSSS